MKIRCLNRFVLAGVSASLLLSCDVAEDANETTFLNVAQPCMERLEASGISDLEQNGMSTPCLVPESTSYVFPNRVSVDTVYDYVPSVMEENGFQHIWWCSSDPGVSDIIVYNSLNLSTRKWTYPITSPKTVLRPTEGTWDARHTCDPSVIRGNFYFDGNNYKYAMYYTATDSSGESVGKDNGVGVAFSNNRIDWVKNPAPIIRNVSLSHGDHYSIGQQVALSGDGGSKVWLWALHLEDPVSNKHLWNLYHLHDGITATKQFQITNDGVYTGQILQADFAKRDNLLYMATNRLNDQTAIDLYTIPWNEQENGAWNYLGTVDESTTLHKYNRFPGFVKNHFGNLSKRTLEVLFTGSPFSKKEGLGLWELSRAKFPIK